MAITYSEKGIRLLEQAKKMEDVSKKYGISYCTIEDKEYPSVLRNIADFPYVIYYRGDIGILNQNKNIAVIGTRKSSDVGVHLSYKAGEMVGDKGINLVNGLALGCDTEALKGALSKGGKCAAVLPCGLDQVQPKSNLKLAEKILEYGGCLLSEYPVGTIAERYRYVERDRLQSGVSQGVLMIEAEEKSGTMHTINFALKQRKRLACYYHGLLKGASGNRYLESLGKAQILKTEEELSLFIDSLLSEEEYEQLSFEFLV